jgi:hydroxymethylbilane synthase
MSARAKLRLGTRGSELARTQSGTIAAALERLGFEVELTIIKTAGDQNTTSAFASIGPQGVFVREIEQALVERRVDVAVHSFKDLPTKSPAELTIGAVPQRVDPADLLLVRRDAAAGPAGDWLPLEAGARVGTASARRRAWLASFRPDLAVEPLRGNVPTRVRRLEEGRFDAIVLAAAGVERLQAEQRLGSALADIAVLRLDPARFVPAPAQGALAVQCRRDDERALGALAHIDHPASRAAVTAERDALARAEGGCDVAFGAYCVAARGRHELVAMLERGGRVHVARVENADPATLGAAAWAKLESSCGVKA